MRKSRQELIYRQPFLLLLKPFSLENFIIFIVCGTFCIISSSFLNLWIGQFISSKLSLKLSSRGMFAATQKENSATVQKCHSNRLLYFLFKEIKLRKLTLCARVSNRKHKWPVQTIRKKNISVFRIAVQIHI